MPLFDIVSEVDKHELANAVDQAIRELSTRYDFRGVNASYEYKENTITLTAESDNQLKQMVEILKVKMAKRNIDIKCLEIKDHYGSGKLVKQEVVVNQGIETNVAKKIVKNIKESKIKVQASIQGEKVRVTGKKRDDLQSIISLLKESNIEIPLQFNNFRD